VDRKNGVVLDQWLAAAADLDGVPALILRKVGKGYALLLNGDINVLKTLENGFSRHSGLDPESRKSLKKLDSGFRRNDKDRNGNDKDRSGDDKNGFSSDAPLGAILQVLAGIEAKITLSREDGSAMRDVEVIRWENGKNEIVALFRQGGKGEPTTVSLPKAGYVYDLRNRKSLGFVKAFKTEILPNRASFFAVTPKAVPAVKVQIGKIEGQRPYFSPRNRALSIFFPGAQGAHAVVVSARFLRRGLRRLPRRLLLHRC